MNAGAFRPRLLFAGTALAAMVFLPLPGSFDVFDSGIYLVVDDDVQDEDAYVLADTARIAGVVDGDLVIAASNLTISGVVTGDVLIASSGSLVISGEVQGAVRGFAREVVIEETGTVGDDLAVAAVTIDVRGAVGRDAIVFGGKLTLTGSIFRDLHGRFVKGDLNGAVGRNVDVATGSLDVGPRAMVDGSLLYRSNRNADVDPAAVVAGQFERLSPRPSFFVDVWWTLATILGIFAFVFTGLLLLWLLPGTTSLAVLAIVGRPWRTLMFGLGVLVLVPVVVVGFAVSLVGVPCGRLTRGALLAGVLLRPDSRGDRPRDEAAGWQGQRLRSIHRWCPGLAPRPLPAQLRGWCPLRDCPRLGSRRLGRRNLGRPFPDALTPTIGRGREPLILRIKPSPDTDSQNVLTLDRVWTRLSLLGLRENHDLVDTDFDGVA